MKQKFVRRLNLIARSQVRAEEETVFGATVSEMTVKVNLLERMINVLNARLFDDTNDEDGGEDKDRNNRRCCPFLLRRADAPRALLERRG
eukprot:7832192-Heterocapsa_arctica.AAC.1